MTKMMIRLLQSHWFSGFIGLVVFFAAFALLCNPATPEKAVLPAQEQTSGQTNPEIDLLMQELRQQREALAQREIELKAWAEQLQNERNELNSFTQNVSRLQMEFDSSVTRIREQESANIKKLARTYAAMAPDAAAGILKSLDDAIVAKTLAMMKESETAPILEALSRQGPAQTKRVADITDRLRLTVAEPTKATTP